MLGEARSKFGTIAGPQGGGQLNGADLKASGKEELEFYGLLTPIDYHFNKEEEIAINYKEVAESYALDECNRTIIKFDIVKHNEH